MNIEVRAFRASFGFGFRFRLFWDIEYGIARDRERFRDYIDRVMRWG